MTQPPIDGEFVETHLARVEAIPAPVTVFGTDDPAAIMQRVVAIATPLAEFIKAKKMSKPLGRGRPGEPPREYVMIEGWSFMGAMLGIAPITREVHEMLDAVTGEVRGFEARVELVTRDGSIVGGGIGECSWSERNWSDRDPYAVKSMAQTRATGKAYRLALGFVMSAAGFEATPAEEMPDDLPSRDVNDDRTTRPMTPRKPVAGSVDAPEGTFTNLGQLLTWALQAHGLSRSQVLEMLTDGDTEITDFDLARKAIEEKLGVPQ